MLAVEFPLPSDSGESGYCQQILPIVPSSKRVKLPPSPRNTLRQIVALPFG
jgi:hypothetical protein